MPLGTNDNKQYGAPDFERYYAGQMTAQEMHALEKAALDDPFLADALEGYKVTRTPVADTAWLKGQLEAKAQNTRVVPFKKNYPFLRIAALVLLLLGAGWSVYYLADNRKDTLALDTKAEKAPAVQKATTPALAPDTASSAIQPLQQTDAAAPETAILPRKKGTTVLARRETEPPAAAAAPPVASVMVDDTPKAMLKAEDLSKDVAAVERKQSVPQALEGRAAGISVENAARPDATIRIRGASTLNSFQGRVVDANNQAVAGAVVSVNNNRTAVATNEEGYFSLNAPDTVVNASVAAIGYEAANITLNRGNKEANIVLNQANESLQEVVVVGYGVKKRQNASRSVNSTLPEPVKGWKEFNDYLQRNRKPASELSSGNLKGSVTLSFGVSRKGTPVDIKVDASLSPQHDAEAIRLLQEGPKWKRAKEARGKVTIPFP